MTAWKKLQVERSADSAARLAIFRLSGVLTDTKECYDLLEEVRRDIQAGHSYVVLNLEGVQRVSSCGIGIVAACYTSVKKTGGRMAVAAVPLDVQKLLELVFLWDHLEHYPTEAEAVAAATE